jgi:lipoprotein-anchoring transpeptidase ErfK/SrfK
MGVSMCKRLIACLVAGATMLGASATYSAPAGKSRNFDHTIETVDPLGRLFGFSRSPVGRTTVTLPGKHRAGTIVISTRERRLYLVLGNGQALRYGIGVGRDGMTWAGTTRVSAKREWPGWTPPPQMRRRQPGLPAHMPGGPDNPLGARALYLGSSLYRIHGSNEPETIGQAVSSGCFRLTNEDVIDLYNRVQIGATVIVQR